MSTVFTLSPGTRPLLISMPHCGTAIPESMHDDYVPRALATEDTDWHMPRLYAFAQALGASVIVPHYARYVIDLNRPPDDTPMYPGASNTELCPTRFFTGEALYREGRAPDRDAQMARLEQYWRPYHEALAGELQRLRRLHGRVLLWDAHSIRSEIPWLFEGRLPDLNVGTANGQAADARIAQAVVAVCKQQTAFSHVLNGRFKGGYITRHYGQPTQGVHAVQLEMCQALYMREQAPYDYLPERATPTIPTLQAMVETALGALEALP
jgi:N-formylglutamate deformylase